MENRDVDACADEIYRILKQRQQDERDVKGTGSRKGRGECLAECVQVAVSNATFHFDKLYSYSVPAHLQDLSLIHI